MMYVRYIWGRGEDVVSKVDLEKAGITRDPQVYVSFLLRSINKKIEATLLAVIKANEFSKHVNILVSAISLMEMSGFYDKNDSENQTNEVYVDTLKSHIDEVTSSLLALSAFRDGKGSQVYKYIENYGLLENLPIDEQGHVFGGSIHVKALNLPSDAYGNNPNYLKAMTTMDKTQLPE